MLGAPGLPQAIRVGAGGTLSYLASDGLSSVSEALDSSGTVTAQQLYAPYGGARYSNGTMPTSKGFTGQRADSGSSELDDYGARSYDPLLGQFSSADTAADGLNRYGYVHGNPTTFVDPTRHNHFCPDLCDWQTKGGAPEITFTDWAHHVIDVSHPVHLAVAKAALWRVPKERKSDRGRRLRVATIRLRLHTLGEQWTMVPLPWPTPERT